VFCNRLIKYEIRKSVIPDLSEMRQMGPYIWGKLQERVKTDPLLGEIAKSMAYLYKMNENNGQSWAASPIVGHTGIAEKTGQTRADGEKLNNTT
jgi:hypothetical protein